MMKALPKSVFFSLLLLLFITQIIAGQVVTMHHKNEANMPDRKNEVGVKCKQDSLIYNILHKDISFFQSYINQKDELGIQIIYTQIDRNKKGVPRFTDFCYNLCPDHYYYPASTVKLPVAILALQRLNELKIAGLDWNSKMVTGKAGRRLPAAEKDSSSPDGNPSIAHYIKKILLVSDNEAFNRLYEFLGQEYINTTLLRMGYESTQIIHRLNISLSEEENRTTNPVFFYNANGDLLYKKDIEFSKLIYAKRDTKLGNGYMRGDELVHEPFDFSQKNRFSLSDLHQVVRAVLFPEATPIQQRFNLTEADYAFLRRYMSMYPSESISPIYDSLNYWDYYVKFLLHGSSKEAANPSIRVFNKVGDAYGFLIDGAYIVDMANQVEFMLSAVIYCNSDSVFNDDKYDYETIGFPFMKKLGMAIYEYERTRVRKNKIDFSPFVFDYKN